MMIQLEKTGLDHTPIKRSGEKTSPIIQQQPKKPEEGVRWELTNVTVFILVIFSEWSLVQNVVV